MIGLYICIFFGTFLFVVGISSRYSCAVIGYCLNSLLHPWHAWQSSCFSLRFLLTKLNQPFFSRIASNIPQITSRQSNILYFFQFKYPKCFSTLVSCVRLQGSHFAFFEEAEESMFFFSFYLLQQADSIVIVGVADGSPAVGQVDFTYSFIFLDTCTLMIL